MSTRKSLACLAPPHLPCLMSMLILLPPRPGHGPHRQRALRAVQRLHLQASGELLVGVLERHSCASPAAAGVPCACQACTPFASPRICPPCLSPCRPARSPLVTAPCPLASLPHAHAQVLSAQLAPPLLPGVCRPPLLRDRRGKGTGAGAEVWAGAITPDAIFPGRPPPCLLAFSSLVTPPS